MKKLVGKYIGVHFEDNTVLEGILFYCDERYIYLRNSSNVSFVVAETSVKYYSTTDHIVTGDEVQNEQKAYKSVNNSQYSHTITVLADGEQIANVPVLPGIDVGTFNQGLVNLVMSHRDVVAFMTNRKHKQIVYDNENYVVHIYLQNGETQLYKGPENNEAVPSSFSMGMTGGGDFTNKFLSPTQAVMRFNKSLSGRKNKNEVQQVSENDFEG